MVYLIFIKTFLFIVFNTIEWNLFSAASNWKHRDAFLCRTYIRLRTIQEFILSD